VGVGLLYQQGYFAQYLNADGWQQERYPINDSTTRLHLERNPDGSELRIAVVIQAAPSRQSLASAGGNSSAVHAGHHIEPNNPYMTKTLPTGLRHDMHPPGNYAGSWWSTDACYAS